MASLEGAEERSSTLGHVYFFVDNNASVNSRQIQEAASTTVSDGSAEQRSRTSSPGSIQTDGTAGTTTTDSSSDMNPLASVFSPRFSDFTPTSIPPPPTATQQFELRKTPNKGFALFATTHIPRGTLIICEQALLRITGENLHSVWGSYCRLGSAQKAAFDSLHGYQAEKLNFENAARTILIDPNDDSLDEDDIEELVADQVRVMKIFSVNNFRIPTYDLGIFAMSSRFNHSCVPNVHYSYNPYMKSATIYAVKDIKPDEELCITYLGGEGHYYVRTQRIELLRSNYGFTCSCSACSDRTGGSNRRREEMAGIAWGLEQFRTGSGQSGMYFPKTTTDALKQAEDLITIMLQEGVETIELGKAYRTASTHALALKDYEMAVRYAANEAEVEKNCLGTATSDLQRNGAAAVCWRDTIYNIIGADLGQEGLEKFGLVATKRQKKRAKKQERYKIQKMGKGWKAEVEEGVAKEGVQW